MIAALAIRQEGNRLCYEAFDQFEEEYHFFFLCVWNYRFQLGAWLDDIVCHSCVWYSEEGFCKAYACIPL